MAFHEDLNGWIQSGDLLDPQVDALTHAAAHAEKIYYPERRLIEWQLFIPQLSIGKQWRMQIWVVAQRGYGEEVDHEFTQRHLAMFEAGHKGEIRDISRETHYALDDPGNLKPIPGFCTEEYEQYLESQHPADDGLFPVEES